MRNEKTIVVPEHIHRWVREAAAKRGETMGAFVSRAMEAEVVKHLPKPKSLGIFASGYTDTARKAGDMKFEPRSWRDRLA